MAIARVKEENVKLRFRKDDPIGLPSGIHYHYFAKNIKAMPADGDTMGTNERLRKSFTSYATAIHQIALVLRKFNAGDGKPDLSIDQAAKTHLNTILFQRYLGQIAPDLMSKECFQKIEELNAPPQAVCEILNVAGAQLSTIKIEGDEIPLEDFVLVAAVSPTQNSMGAYFTPPTLASQICLETIANWVIPLVPDALRQYFDSQLQQTIARQEYLTGPSVGMFFTQLPEYCQKGLERKEISLDFLKGLCHKILKCSIFDPACGSGIFLAEAVKIKLKILSLINPIVGKSTLHTKIALETITRSLYGIDLMPEYIHVARCVVFFAILPHLTQEDIIPTFTAICQQIQVGNFILSPFGEKLKTHIPPALNAIILIELATCFLDVFTNNEDMHSQELTPLVDLARGPMEAIPTSAWEKIAKYLGIPTSTAARESLPRRILEQLLPPIKLNNAYDIILGNPPEEGARKETGRQKITSWTTRIQRLLIRYLKKQQLYSDLQGAWDFSLPFASRSMELLASGGMLALILPRSIGTQSYASRLLGTKMQKIRRVVYFNLQSNAIFEIWNPVQQELVPAGNDFLVLSCINSSTDVLQYKVEEISPLDYLGVPGQSEMRKGEDVRRFLAQPPNMPRLPGIPLKFFVTITKGATLCAKAEWRRTRGSFKTRDLVSGTRDPNHPLRFIEPSHIGPFFIAGESFLEYNHAQYPDRVPANIHRWREDSFFHGPLLVTPLSKRVPSFALIPPDFEDGAWRSPETVVLFKRWSDWFREFPDRLPPAIERIKAETITALEQNKIPASMVVTDHNAESLGKLSNGMPLEVLALILSCPVVHELRLKGGKSFGKFEAGDWDNIPLPILEEKEKVALLDHYSQITKTLEIVLQGAPRSGKSSRQFIKGLEGALFRDFGSQIKGSGEEGTDRPEIRRVRKHLQQSFALISNAYARTIGMIKK